MTPNQLLDRLAAVRIDRSHGGRAPHQPHQPLMLLLALARVGLGPESRLARAAGMGFVAVLTGTTGREVFARYPVRAVL